MVVVNWNGGEKLLACLESLFSQRFRDFEVILVDNGSQDGSIEKVKKLYKDKVAIIENEANLGFAKGCNQGIRASSGPWVGLINNDVVADPRWLLEFLRRGQGRPDTGMVASRVLHHDDRDRLDSIGVGLYPDGMSRAMLRGKRDSGRFDSRSVIIPSGAACLLRREMLDDIGLFSEDFFAYADDTDLALRGQIAGWKCVFAPAAVAYHHYSSTAGPYSAMKIFHAERNRIWVMIRFYPVTMILKSGFYSFLRYCAVLYYMSRPGTVTRGKSGIKLFGAVIAVVGAYLSAIRGVRAQWRERKTINKGGSKSFAQMRAWLKEFKLDLETLSS